jgi:hypothetical protein
MEAAGSCEMLECVHTTCRGHTAVSTLHVVVIQLCPHYMSWSYSCVHTTCSGHTAVSTLHVVVIQLCPHYMSWSYSCVHTTCRGHTGVSTLHVVVIQLCPYYMSWSYSCVLFSGAFARLRKATVSFVMSVRPHSITRPPLDGF